MGKLLMWIKLAGNSRKKVGYKVQILPAPAEDALENIGEGLNY